jgi:hypothetical protein
MKTTLLTIALATAFSAASLLAEEGMQCCCKKAADPNAATQAKVEAKTKAADAEVNALLEQMNAATGEKKVEAMAALLNRMLQERKSMQDKMAAMHAKMAAEKKADAASAKKSCCEPPSLTQAMKPATPAAEPAAPAVEPAKPAAHQH